MFTPPFLVIIFVLTYSTYKSFGLFIALLVFLTSSHIVFFKIFKFDFGIKDKIMNFLKVNLFNHNK